MNPELEIIIPVRNPDQRLERTAASVATQTDRKFSVILSDNGSSSGLKYIKEAQQQLASVGIPVRRIQAAGEMRRLEHWSWTQAQAQADWLKPLPVGSEVKPVYVEAFNQRIHQQPQARFVRCDTEVRTEWGPETVRAPFPQSSIRPAEVLNYFPARIRWLATGSSVAYQRVALPAAGGYSVQLPGCAFLNLNLILALHHGLENI